MGWELVFPTFTTFFRVLIGRGSFRPSRHRCGLKRESGHFTLILFVAASIMIRCAQLLGRCCGGHLLMITILRDQGKPPGSVMYTIQRVHTVVAITDDDHVCIELSARSEGRIQVQLKVMSMQDTSVCI